MTVLTNHQRATDHYISSLKKSLSEVKTKWSSLGDKLADIKEKLKGSEAALEEV